MSEVPAIVKASVSDDAHQFYQRASDVKLNPPDSGGPETDFIERFLVQNGKVNEAAIKQAKHAFIFTKKLLTSKQKSSKRAHNLLTSHDKRVLGIYNITRDYIHYETFLKIHHIWKGYFRNAVNPERAQNMESLQAAMMKADYTGCQFVVGASKCPSYIGIKGLVIQETKNIFKLITHEDKIVSIPKQGSIFVFTLDDKMYKIYGSYFRKHSFERGKVKFKVTENVEL